MLFSFTPFLAQAKTPTTPGEISATIQESLLKSWDGFVEHVPFLGVGFIVLLLTWGVAKVVSSVAARTLRKSKLRGSLQDLLTRLAVILVWVTGIMVAMTFVLPGVTPAKALGGLGLASVAVGFAFKDIFENFFAGILLLWRFPFENGDYIECEGIEGKVERINIRMSEIRKTTGELVVVPNAFLFSNPVDVLTNLPHRRVTVMAGVSYDTKLDEALPVIEQAVKTCDTVNQNQPVQIFPQAFGSSSIDIEVTWWTAPKPADIRTSLAQVIEAVKGALDDAGIEIPFPYRTLTFKGPLPIIQNS
ncbi:MAG: small conductance mechanosensitive channel [Verrucomicrobiales bacterium]|jgi:small conductance mechanosensitive channel